MHYMYILVPGLLLRENRCFVIPSLDHHTLFTGNEILQDAVI